jgi:hypothetical protein
LVYKEKEIVRVSEQEVLADDSGSDADSVRESFDLADVHRALASSRESTPGSRKRLDRWD